MKGLFLYLILTYLDQSNCIPLEKIALGTCIKLLMLIKNLLLKGTASQFLKWFQKEVFTLNLTNFHRVVTFPKSVPKYLKDSNLLCISFTTYELDQHLYEKFKNSFFINVDIIHGLLMIKGL